jgi:FkbM family methyltransferase
MNNTEFFRNFSAAGGKKYLFGINQYADEIAKSMSVDGYIDQYTDKSEYNGKPIVRLEDIAKDSLVVSTVTNSRPKTALKKIADSGIENFIDYFSFSEASNGLIPQLSCISDMRLDHKGHSDDYQWVRGLMADQESIKTFDSVMDFRLNALIASMNGFSFRVEQQYFEQFLNLSSGEVFVDGGGYDGFTTLEFVKKCPQYGAVHFFEPSALNLEKARKNLSQLNNIFYYELGLYDKEATLCFDAGDGSACRISDSGAEKIHVNALDAVVHDKVTFIKLDLEGAEMSALSGMRKHIINDQPKLAVAVYHQPSDFRTIPKYILGLRDDYDVHLRHYTEGGGRDNNVFYSKKMIS